MVEVAAAAAGFLDRLIARIRPQFTDMCCFNSNIMELETRFRELETTRQGVQRGVDENCRQVRFVGPNVEAWLTRANDVLTEVERIIQDKAKVREGCINGWCPNLKLHYSLSKKAVMMTKVMVCLQDGGIQYTQSSYSPPPACLETITNRDFMGFESRRLNMEEIIMALKHDEINLIGVCGMGGVGKTTLVNEVARRGKEEKQFDEVAMVAVGLCPNLTNVQDCIADTLGLKNIRDVVSPQVRADLLRRRLLHNKMKVLVVLDDVWAEFDLQAMGFPLEGADKNFKMLYTSRTQDLWHDLRTKKEIPLELLSEDEAWQLFKEKAGDSADAQDLKPIAKQIVNECGRLPLALVLIGWALSKKSGRNAIKEIWKDMLHQLTCASNTSADKHLYLRLQLSYEYLECEEARRLFLLCCLFEEDEYIHLEDLARYGFGLSFFDGMNQMAEVRCRVYRIVDDLKSHYLLVDSGKEECVKVHNMVRHMGISIASKGKLALVMHGAISQWPKTATHEHYSAISMIMDQIEEFPEGLTYPNLEFLMLRCHELEKLPPNFFESMGKLKVLELRRFCGILPLQPLKNLTTLSLEGFCGTLDNVSLIGGILNLEILNFRYSMIEELPKEIGELVNLRLLDLRDTPSLTIITPGVISRLVNLEELYFSGSQFIYWEGEGNEEAVRNANLREFEFLSNLNTLEISIRSHVLIPRVPIFSKLKRYKVVIADSYYFDERNDDFDSINITDFVREKFERVLVVLASIAIPSNRGGIDLLLRSSDWLYLKGEGCNDLVRELLLQDGVNGLQQMKVLQINRCNLSSNPEQNNNVGFLSVFPQKVSLPNLEVLNVAELQNLETLGHVPLSVGSFSKLKKISVHDCGKLLCVFPSQLVPMLRGLQELTVKSCDSLEVVFGLEGLESNEPNPEILSPLKFVKFCYLPQLNCISKRDPVGFKYIETLEIHDCNSLRCVFAPTMTNSIPQLRELKISSCDMLSRIVAEENGLGESSVDEVEFPQLESLELLDLPNLVSFFPNVNTTTLAKSTYHLHNPIQPQPLFNKKVAFPGLKYLGLSGLENVSDLWCSELPTISFSKLKQLEVRDCASLRKMFHPSMVQGLVNLQKLFINYCSTLEAVVGKEEQIGGFFLFPQLQKLRLNSLPNLMRFCHFTHPLEMPLLSEVDILDCPNMDAFSLGPVSTPKLSLLGTPWNSDRNNAIPLLQENRRKEEEEKEDVDEDEEDQEAGQAALKAYDKASKVSAERERYRTDLDSYRTKWRISEQQFKDSEAEVEKLKKELADAKAAAAAAAAAIAEAEAKRVKEEKEKLKIADAKGYEAGINRATLEYTQIAHKMVNDELEVRLPDFYKRGYAAGADAMAGIMVIQPESGFLRQLPESVVPNLELPYTEEECAPLPPEDDEDEEMVEGVNAEKPAEGDELSKVAEADGQQEVVAT